MDITVLSKGDLVGLVCRILPLRVAYSVNGSVFVETQDNFRVVIPYKENEVEPILLSERICELNGLVKHTKFGHSTEDNTYSISNGRFNDGFYTVSGFTNGLPYSIDLPKPIKYVHELQHALRLCGLNDIANNFKA